MEKNGENSERIYFSISYFLFNRRIIVNTNSLGLALNMPKARTD